ncbi:MAG: hypothetical protein ACYCS2_07965 [Acidimicrobiales bacterium]
MFVEVTRLLIVILFTALGYAVGHHVGVADDPSNFAPLAGAALGACFGYVGGGIGARGARSLFGRAEEHLLKAPPAQLLTGALGALAAGGLAAVVGVPIVVALPHFIGLPLYSLLTWLAASAGARTGVHRSGEMLAMAGLSSRPLVRATSFGADPEGDAALVDSSAAIDGRILALARAGFLPGPLLVPRFVLDEIQSIADAQDPSRRRRGRRGLEVLQAIRSMGTAVHVLDDEMVEHSEVDAKLVALALRLKVGLLTVDEALQRVAELQGVRCLNPGQLAESIRPEHSSGDLLRVPITRPGRDEGQGVGFLEDGTMVVVTDADGLVGSEIDVRITGQVQTSLGTMLFAAVAAD